MTNYIRSFGTIPVMKTDEGLQFFLINMYGSAGGTHWTFPKGRPEPNETAVESALRETKEETGLEITDLHTKKSFIHAYNFKYNDEPVEKEVEYFIGFVTDPSTETLQEEEVKEAGWFTATDAMERITYDTNKELFAEVLQYIDANIDTM